ncbi:hypothetical protein GCM10010435_94590 [Winogradskya consettensis]|uniref:Uncharacterized protein n=1 Tax=Winogradskya consettensis TaxID=113560 RepID=A0A919SZ51_9ACTN|nr:hypothetical protein [Actinoplanes consettensis]GIM79853.1 hypothetical protein Aco04nite_67630 [Actinoplanes consettensis]
MGYDWHITRAFVSYESRWFPILGTEVDALVNAEPDLLIPAGTPKRPDFCYVSWTGEAADEDDYLIFQDGRLSRKNPRPAFLRRMAAIAAHLDAWLIGDNCEVYADPTAWERGPAAFATRHFITRGPWHTGENNPPPIHTDEWAALVDTQPDFEWATRIEAVLPSGARPIPCPPTATWTTHPTAHPVPFFMDDDAIQVRNADPPTITRMKALAVPLKAHILDDNAQPA